jgi:hypothetical protein
MQVLPTALQIPFAGGCVWPCCRCGRCRPSVPDVGCDGPQTAGRGPPGVPGVEKLAALAQFLHVLQPQAELALPLFCCSHPALAGLHGRRLPLTERVHCDCFKLWCPLQRPALQRYRLSLWRRAAAQRTRQALLLDGMRSQLISYFFCMSSGWRRLFRGRNSCLS